jgi:hypothetical protein
MLARKTSKEGLIWPSTLKRWSKYGLFMVDHFSLSTTIFIR